jgi:large subunit ribosomal protein L23
MRHASAIIDKIQLTEKGTMLSDAQNKYIFRVDPTANKSEIKHAVETLFNVSVTSVNTMKYDGKKKRLSSARYGKRSDWKRAIVTLKDGDTIDLV